MSLLLLIHLTTAAVFGWYVLKSFLDVFLTADNLLLDKLEKKLGASTLVACVSGIGLSIQAGSNLQTTCTKLGIYLAIALVAFFAIRYKKQSISLAPTNETLS
jgi:hypothetical protein